MQIVDARNPYFFYSADLEKYIGEVGDGKKQFILLVNKADYLSEELIAHWNAYFNEQGIQHIFFSALEEQTKIDEGELDEVSENEDENDSDESEASNDEQNEEEREEQVDEEGTIVNQAEEEKKREVEETHGGFKNELERQERDE